MKTRSSILLYATSVGLFAAWALLPISWTSDRPHVAGEMFYYDSITILAPFVSSTLFYASTVMAGVLLALALLAYRWPVVRFPVVALLLAIVAFPYAGLNNAFSNLGSWTMHGRATDSLGNSYVFCDSSFLQGQIMALTRVDVESTWFTRLKVLGANNGDSPRSWASIIRPTNPTDEYGQLYLTQSNMLVGIRYDNHCYLAYDPERQQFSGHGDIELISPFICVDADDGLHDGDIQSIVKTISESTSGTSGCPHKESIESELNNPNPNVRRAAETLLTMLDSPKVNRRDAEQTDEREPE